MCETKHSFIIIVFVIIIVVIIIVVVIIIIIITIMFKVISHTAEILVSLIFAVRADINQISNALQQYPFLGT